ncbi:MAG: hypothetical protein HYX72_09025 [Acidobacteria bacterium]|nr:hypothetical protein [Acidobacteriota bacterium]
MMGSIPIRFRHVTSAWPAMSARRKKQFSVPKEVKRLARATLGSPPATRVVQDRRRKPPKHKKELLEEN